LYKMKNFLLRRSIFLPLSCIMIKSSEIKAACWAPAGGEELPEACMIVEDLGMYEDRIQSAALRGQVMSAEDAARMIKSGMTIGTSGFTRIGYPKAVSLAIAELGTARDLTVICGASVGDELDGSLARSGQMKRRYAFQTNNDLRARINSGDVLYTDIHLGRVTQALRRGEFGKVDVAILECCLIHEDGSFVPTLSVGLSMALADCAEKVILELNLNHPVTLEGLHDISSRTDTERRLLAPMQRVGDTFVRLDPKKVAAVVVSDMPDQHPDFPAPGPDAEAMATEIISFLEHEIDKGLLSPSFCIQSGVGAVANAVLAGLGRGKFQNLSIFTEVIQDSALRLIEQGVVTAASATSLCLSRECEAHFYENFEFFKKHIVLRPQNISNCDTLIRRFRVVAMNTAVEADLYGNVNSTHIAGSRIINGIGGSSDFAHNAGISIFMTPSIGKKGAISRIVPMATHVDSTEHDVQVLVTEQGLADLRFLAPRERAERMIECCCHPDYRPALRTYYERACKVGAGLQTPHDLATAFAWHQRYLETGSMKEEPVT